MDEVVAQETPVAGTMSVIGGGITITGNIEAEVDLQIAGQVNGDVRCATLILEETSVIRGSVHAERVRASGAIEGSVETRDLAVEASARINGDVTYSRIRIANGAIVQGKRVG
jgi:cytoskeletal protein CcmA (bactofilin family)